MTERLLTAGEVADLMEERWHAGQQDFIESRPPTTSRKLFRRFRRVRQHGRTLLLHVGDYGPSGVAILEHDRINASQEIIPVRVALTETQVTTYGLATSLLRALPRGEA